MTTKNGITGFVKLNDHIAEKYSDLNCMYWVNEYSILMYLWKYNLKNIIKYQSCSFVRYKNPKSCIKDYYCKFTFPLYKNVLSEYKVYKDITLIQIMLDLLSAVKFLHNKKIMHRDIKPANILIDTSETKTKAKARAILIDFSHSIRIRSDNVALCKDIVTYPYRAPEVFEYQYMIKNTTGYDEKIDIWSIGIILFELITKSDLYLLVSDGSESHFSVFLLYSNYLNTIKSLYSKNKKSFQWADEYIKWIEKMLEKNPKKRIDAANMYGEILEFAIRNNIEIQIPENNNGMYIYKTPTISNFIISDSNHDLISFNLKMIRVYKNICGLIVPIEYIKQILTYLVMKETITKENAKHMALAISMIVDNVIYDNIIEIHHAVKILKDYNINDHDLINCITTIIQNHEKDLFFTDMFKFSNMTDIVEIDSVNSTDLGNDDIGCNSSGNSSGNSSDQISNHIGNHIGNQNNELDLTPIFIR